MMFRVLTEALHRPPSPVRRGRVLTRTGGRVGSVIAAVGLLLVGFVTISPGVASAASAPGITAKTIDLGFITDITGFGAASTGKSVLGWKARIAAQNAAGGVNGRKITYHVEDTQSSPTSALTAAQLLVTTDQVFGIGSLSLATASAIPYLVQSGVPFIGQAGYNGGTWTKATKNLISIGGNQNANYNPATTTILKWFKQHGVTKLAYLTYSNLPVVVKGNMAFDYVAQQLGITVTSIPISITSLPNITSLVLSVENSGATGLYAAVLPNYTYGILTGLQQAGYKVKVGLSLAGQGQPLLDDPSALAAAQGLYFVTPWDTFSPGFAKMRAALKKYENFPGLPDLNIPYGWLAADLMIQGLQAAGKNPTQASFLAATKAIKNYSADGMLNPAVSSVAQSIDAKALGAPGFCQRLLHLQGTQFLAAGLICGKLLKGFGGE